jgi:hypothetical protein
MIEQAVQLLGAFLVLGGFAGLQVGRLRVDDAPYLLLNAVGSGLLLIIAILDREWGFILLEGVWTAVSIVALLRLQIARSNQASR